jgi:Uma2 family endonuclease
MTTQPRPARLTADEFLAWASEHAEGRYELVEGEIVAMAAERLGHARAKLAAVNALAAAIAERGLPCEAIVDGMAVRISDRTVFEPHAFVRCGPPAPDNAIDVSDAVVVVEITSPSSRSYDTGAKLAGYFSLPSVMHYLVVDIGARVLAHHRREAAGDIATRILRNGPLTLDPPGITLEVERLFPPAERAA